MIAAFDPGAHTGMAVIDHGRLVHHQTVAAGSDTGMAPVLAAVEALRAQYGFTRAVVEKPRLGVFYARHAGKCRSAAGMTKITQNVGQNIALTHEIELTLKRAGIAVLMVNPWKGTTKWDTKAWAAVLRWNGKSPSEHARDAAILGFLYENHAGFNQEVGK